MVSRPTVDVMALKSSELPEAVPGRVSEEETVHFWTQFGKAQLSSLAATVVDYSTLFILVEVSGVYYAFAVGIGALLGAGTNFFLNRHWSFRAQDGAHLVQAWRYAQVSVTSLGLNVTGTYVFTEIVGIQYGFSRIITSLLVGLLFNFPLHRRYVFK